jgi:hypothetical protein
MAQISCKTHPEEREGGGSWAGDSKKKTVMHTNDSSYVSSSPVSLYCQFIVVQIYIGLHGRGHRKDTEKTAKTKQASKPSVELPQPQPILCLDAPPQKKRYPIENSAQTKKCDLLTRI